MRKRRPNHKLPKIHRSYTVEEVARLFGTHKNTVRAWVKAGLPTCDSKRPILILGRELSAYLEARRTKNKRPCQPGEIYCVRCRAPKRPAGDMAEYQPITADSGKSDGHLPGLRTDDLPARQHGEAGPDSGENERHDCGGTGDK